MITANIVNDACDDLSTWVVAPTGSVSIDSGFDFSCTSAYSFTSLIQKTISDTTNPYTLEVETYFDNIADASLSSGNLCGCAVLLNSKALLLVFSADGNLYLTDYLYENLTLIKSGVVRCNANAAIQKWRFEVNVTTNTMNSYLDDLLIATSSNVLSDGVAGGLLLFTLNSGEGIERSAHIKSIKIGSGLGVFSSSYVGFSAYDMEDRTRINLNDISSSFFTEAEIFRWLSIGAKDIAQKTDCVKRILPAQTSVGSRFVEFNAYKVFHVEYIPSTGRRLMLTKIDPLKIGHYKIDGVTPQYWYNLGNHIVIEPIPTAIYNLRLYVSDIPKLLVDIGE